MTTLARRLRTFDYFTLAFGAMVGAGWLVVMDDWLTRGGPAGAMLGFAIGTLLLIPIGYAYSRMVVRLPEAGSEIAYATRAFNDKAGFFAGWMMLLAYLIVCPWEAVAIGKIAGHFVPALNSLPLYAIGGKTVYLPQVAMGIALTVLITWLNFRGIAVTSKFQNWATTLFLVLFAVLVVIGGTRGSVANFQPWFGHAPWLSVLLTLQIVPYFMTGFESVGKCSEESEENFKTSHYAKAIYTALLVGGAFYVVVIAVVAFVAPWQQTASSGFATAAAFHQASPFLANLIFAAAVVSLVKIFNANFVAAARWKFAASVRSHSRTQSDAVGTGALAGRNHRGVRLRRRSVAGGDCRSRLVCISGGMAGDVGFPVSFGVRQRANDRVTGNDRRFVLCVAEGCAVDSGTLYVGRVGGAGSVGECGSGVSVLGWGESRDSILRSLIFRRGLNCCVQHRD